VANRVICLGIVPILMLSRVAVVVNVTRYVLLLHLIISPVFLRFFVKYEKLISTVM